MSKTTPLAATAPRYTSYPTAPHFHEGVTESTVGGWLADVGREEPLSIYVHIPFCDKLCWFCACHTRHTLRYQPVAEYLGLLHREIDIVARRLAGHGTLRSLHWGGGSPTMLTPADMDGLAATLRGAFRTGAQVEFSVEIDPADMDAARLDALASIGVTRASLGVQDFDPRVQQAINRPQGFDLTRDVVDGLRSRRIDAVNLDLVYGLPHQTVESVEETVRQCLSLRPDRIALFGYAHVPWFKKHQKLIEQEALPDQDARLAQSRAAARLINGAGYVAIGIDHFALPGDPLALAAREGRLRRNFQGYTDDACETLIGLGTSSVSRYRQGYAQSVKSTAGYEKALRHGRLPVERGFALAPDDLARAWVVERLMCDFGFSAGELVQRFRGTGLQIVAEAEALREDNPSWLVRTPAGFEVPEDTRPYVRSVAACFDSYLDRKLTAYSSTV